MMHPGDMPKIKEDLQKTLVSWLISINAAKLTKEDRADILNFPLGILVEKDSGYLVNSIEAYINDDLRSRGLKLKMYAVYALATGDFNHKGIQNLRNITESIIGEDPTKEDIVTVRHAIDALMNCIIPIEKAA